MSDTLLRLIFDCELVFLDAEAALCLRLRRSLDPPVLATGTLESARTLSIAHHERPLFEDSADLRRCAFTQVSVHVLLQLVLAKAVLGSGLNRPLQGLVLQRIVRIYKTVGIPPVINGIHDLVIWLKGRHILRRHRRRRVQLAPFLAPALLEILSALLNNQIRLISLQIVPVDAHELPLRARQITLCVPDSFSTRRASLVALGLPFIALSILVAEHRAGLVASLLLAILERSPIKAIPIEAHRSFASIRVFRRRLALQHRPAASRSAAVGLAFTILLLLLLMHYPSIFLINY